MSNKKPLVSVVIPVYNAALYVEESLRSIINQTYNNLEILVIDDCSKDDSVKIVENIAKTDPRVRLIKNKSNLGIGGNRDKGIKNSKGKYICWQDADDVSLPDRIEQQVDFLENHPKVGVVGGFITFFDVNGPSTTRKYAEDDQSLRGAIFKYNPVAQPASMARAECYKMVGGYDPHYRLSEDLEMLFRIGERYAFGNIQKVVLMYRQTESSLTASNLKNMEKATLEIRKRYSQSKAYDYSPGDALFNKLQSISMMMPFSLRMRLFKLIRGDSKA